MPFGIEFDLSDVVALLTVNLFTLIYIGCKMSAGTNLSDAVVSLENSATALEQAVQGIIASKGDNVSGADAQLLADRINGVAVALTNSANSLK